MIIVIFGVSGTGKSTIGSLLAEQLEWPYIDADDYHPESNIKKMAAGNPLNDDDRWPWLDILRHELTQYIQKNKSAVLACSALKLSYRERLSPDTANVHFIHLQADFDLVHARIQQRSGHFMPIELLRSQYADLEPCYKGVEVSVDQTPVEIVKEIRHELGLTKNQRATVLADGLMFPEAPRWHENTLWFTDQHAKTVMKMKPDGQLSEIMKTDDLPGGLGWLPDGSLLVVLMTKRMVYRYINHHLEVYADLSALAGFHCNDMLVDQKGRAWVGNFGYDLHAGEAIKPAEIISIKSQGHSAVTVDNVIFPNGMAITPDQGSLFVAETFASRISVFDIAEDGMLNHAGIWADLKGAYPDGICLAADGTLWIAAPNIGQVIHVEKEGKVLDRVSTKGRPYACMLGGSELNILYITTSETDDPAKAVKQRSGRIEMISLTS